MQTWMYNPEVLSEMFSNPRAETQHNIPQEDSHNQDDPAEPMEPVEPADPYDPWTGERLDETETEYHARNRSDGFDEMLDMVEYDMFEFDTDEFDLDEW